MGFRHVGFSSSSLRHNSALDLLHQAELMGATCLDLRAGRGQGWEDDLALLASKLPICFVGTDIRIGSGSIESSRVPEMVAAAAAIGIPLRCFNSELKTDEEEARFVADVAVLRSIFGPDVRLAVEMHEDNLSLERLDRVLTKANVGAIIDTLGLIRLNANFEQMSLFSQRHAIAAQVKGISSRGSDFWHVPLDRAPILAAWMAALIHSLNLPVTIETKAESISQDMDFMRCLLAEHAPRPVPAEIISCIPAS